MRSFTETHWDVIVVGGGSAGCVLANRLSADPGCRVLLVEAGPDSSPDHEPEDIADPYPYQAAFNGAYHWRNLRVRFGTYAKATDPLRKYEQARVIGGGSSINGLLANRGTPEDYDEWEAQGAKGWGWSDVVPYFRKLETDLEAEWRELHGDCGPIRISRTPEVEWPGFSKAARIAFSGDGLAALDDQNAQFGEGWFPMAASTDGLRRVSSAAGYLTQAVRARKNLVILPETHVHRITMQGNRATGVATQKGTLRANRVIMCAGALMSPSLLLRSGIGPGKHLMDLGLPVIADLPGVGQNLQEHPSIALSAFIEKGHRMEHFPRRHVHVGMRYSSGIGPTADMFVVAVARAAWHPLGSRIGSLFGWVNKPFGRGQLNLVSPDPLVQPKVNFNLLNNPSDLVRMVALVQKLAHLFSQPGLREASRAPFLARHGALAAMVGRKTPFNHLVTLVPALAADGPRALQGLIFGRLVDAGEPLEGILAQPQKLEEAVRAFTIGGWHPCGTCRMGSVNQAMSVTNPADLAVVRTRNLHIADASVMPTIPRANTNIPTIMIAEKSADAIMAAARMHN